MKKILFTGNGFELMFAEIFSVPKPFNLVIFLNEQKERTNNKEYSHDYLTNLVNEKPNLSWEDIFYKIVKDDFKINDKDDFYKLTQEFNSWVHQNYLKIYKDNIFNSSIFGFDKENLLNFKNSYIQKHVDVYSGKFHYKTHKFSSNENDYKDIIEKLNIFLKIYKWYKNFDLILTTNFINQKQIFEKILNDAKELVLLFENNIFNIKTSKELEFLIPLEEISDNDLKDILSISRKLVSLGNLDTSKEYNFGFIQNLHSYYTNGPSLGISSGAYIIEGLTLPKTKNEHYDENSPLGEHLRTHINNIISDLKKQLLDNLKLVFYGFSPRNDEYVLKELNEKLNIKSIDYYFWENEKKEQLKIQEELIIKIFSKIDKGSIKFINSNIFYK